MFICLERVPLTLEEKNTIYFGILFYFRTLAKALQQMILNAHKEFDAKKLWVYICIHTCTRFPAFM